MCSLYGCQISCSRIDGISVKFPYAVLLQYRAEFPIEFPSRIGYQLGDVSDRFPTISIVGFLTIENVI